MNVKNGLLSVLASSSLILSGCGGGGDSSNSYSNSSSNSNQRTILPYLDTNGYSIVTDIINLDLNNDGFQDLVFFRTLEEPFYKRLYIQALINNGDKTFTDKTNDYFSTIGNEWNWIDKAYLVDLNGDGLLDIVGHIDQGYIKGLPPLIRKPSGEFTITTNQVILDNMGAMLPIDTDSDGDIDILSRKSQNIGDSTDQLNEVHEWTLLENTTTGNELEFKSHGVVSNNVKGKDYRTFVYSPVIIDINSDGYQDFVYGGPIWKRSFVDKTTPLNVFLNSTQNTFIESSEEVFEGNVPSYTHVREMVSADFYGNGYQSILIANTGYDNYPFPGEKNAILKNDGTGTLTEQIGNIYTHNYKGFTHSTDVADIDKDGDIDIVYTDITGYGVSDEKKIRILVNDGVGNFSKKSFTYEEKGWTATKLVDLNNDGYPELVLGAMNLANESLILWNDGKGNF